MPPTALEGSLNSPRFQRSSLEAAVEPLPRTPLGCAAADNVPVRGSHL